MCVLKSHIKLFIFKNIFSKIKKVVNIFSIFDKFFSKNENYCISSKHILATSIYKNPPFETEMSRQVKVVLVVCVIVRKGIFSLYFCCVRNFLLLIIFYFVHEVKQ